MSIKAETKIVKNAGSLRTTVPKKIAELLNLDEGDYIRWNLDITEKGPILVIIPAKKEEEK